MKKTVRSPYDFYPTPREVIDNLLINRICIEGTVLEPCCGDGVIVQALRNDCGARVQVDAIEIDESHSPQLKSAGIDNVQFCDFLTANITKRYDYIITNPPFSLAQEFIEKSLTLADKGVIMLLRLNFLGSQKRHDFWIKNPPSAIYVLSKRPSFTGNGTDNQDYAWFVWDKKIHEIPISVL